MEPADLELLGMQNVERSSPLSRFREVLTPKSFLRPSRSPRPPSWDAPLSLGAFMEPELPAEALRLGSATVSPLGGRIARAGPALFERYLEPNTRSRAIAASASPAENASYACLAVSTFCSPAIEQPFLGSAGNDGPLA